MDPCMEQIEAVELQEQRGAVRLQPSSSAMKLTARRSAEMISSEREFTLEKMNRNCEDARGDIIGGSSK